ncbi:MAG: septum formation protein Maf [Ruminococcus sp.]|nr:septum formation protein Maf [Ruminococcus sp.]
MFNMNRLFDCEVILASQSPRRKELLSLIFDSFRIKPAQSDEVIDKNTPTDLVPQSLALDKCKEIAKSEPHALVIGCDTAVILGDLIMGKPEDDDDAYSMLSQLSGKTHKVISGVAVYYNGEYTQFSSVTEVTFKSLTEQDIWDYIATGEPSDKAGAYGIQGKGSVLVESINGDYFNVVGLPVSDLATTLKKLAYK